MQSFKNFFEDYMKRYQLSQNAFSKKSGVSRRTLGRYLTGESYPNTWEKVNLLVENLGLDEAESETVYQIYKYNRSGEKQLYAAGLLDKIMKKQFEHRTDEGRAFGENSVEEVPASKLLQSKEEILSHLAYVLDTKSVVRICTGADIADWIDALHACMNKSGTIHVDHMLNLNKITNENDTKDFECLEKIMPLFFGDMKYRVWSCYVENVIGNQNCILSDRGIVLFDEALSRGFFSTQTEYISYYEKIIWQKLESCKCFGEGYDIGMLPMYQEAECFIENEESNISISLIIEGQKEKICIKTNNSKGRIILLEDKRVVAVLKEILISEHQCNKK